MKKTLPTTLMEIYERLQDGELPHVVYTGDPKSLQREDRRNGAERRAVRAWQASSTLNDYAERRAQGLVPGGVYGYLKGGGGWPASQYSPGESRTTRRSPKFRSARYFAVPPTVHPSGWALMLGHFKLEQAGLKRTRLHFLDDTAVSGLVYVGYIGEHLPTHRTR